jgi:2-polyprenyl-6-methoxyphenol hydroxylase-like FAD-dependent oxidoreductase
LRPGSILGDAAHPVSPAGGQGANASIADGRAIAELILAGERNLQAAYEHRRRPANRRSLRFTRLASFVFGLPESLVFSRLSASLLRGAARRPSLIARGLKIVSTAFVG